MIISVLLLMLLLIQIISKLIISRLWKRWHGRFIVMRRTKLLMWIISWMWWVIMIHHHLGLLAHVVLLHRIGRVEIALLGSALPHFLRT